MNPWSSTRSDAHPLLLCWNVKVPPVCVKCLPKPLLCCSWYEACGTANIYLMPPTAADGAVCKECWPLWEEGGSEAATLLCLQCPMPSLHMNVEVLLEPVRAGHACPVRSQEHNHAGNRGSGLAFCPRHEGYLYERVGFYGAAGAARCSGDAEMFPWCVLCMRS